MEQRCKPAFNHLTLSISNKHFAKAPIMGAFYFSLLKLRLIHATAFLT